MKLGVAYYPEYTPRERWQADMQNIKDLGIDTIRFGEFAWVRLQPSENEFDFVWMDEAIEMAAQVGLKVIMTTPTVCPPIWMVEAHEEVMPVNREGRRAGFGGRQHRCFNSPAYLQYSRIIVEKLAKRYGKHPAVVGWQIDNELGGEQKTCYCDCCRAKFQDRLKEKYKTLDALNYAWMTDFWSQKYSDWTQIPVPSRLNTDMELSHNPGLRLAFAEHCSDSIIEFAAMQYEILKKECAPGVFVTTNQDTFTFGDNVDIYKLFGALDIPAFDIYTQDAEEFAFYCDVFKGCAKTPEQDFLLLEFGATTPEAAKYMEYAESVNCKAFSLFTYRSFRNGQERGFQAVYDAVGRPTSAVDEINRFNADAARRCACAEKRSDCEARPKVYLFYDFLSSWALEIATPSWVGERHKYHRVLLNNVYRELFEAQYDVEFIYDSEQICEKCAGGVLVMANHLITTPQLESTLADFLNAGGRLITTENSFTMDDSSGLREEIAGIKSHNNVVVLPDNADRTAWREAVLSD